MEAAFFFVENRQGDDFNQIPHAHQRARSPFWQSMGSVLGLVPERFPHNADGISPEIAAIREYERRRQPVQPPGILATIVGDLVDEARESAGKAKTKIGAAVAWLTETLAAGPVAQRDIQEQGALAGHSLKNLTLAKARLGVESLRRKGIWWWATKPDA
jgi:hypothetical protein